MSRKNKQINLSYRDKYLKIIRICPDVEKLLNGNVNEISIHESGKDSNKQKDLVHIALETWKLEKKINKIKEKNRDVVVQGMEYSINKIYEILDKNYIKVIDYTGKKYNEGMNGVEIVAVEKNESQVETIIFDSMTPMIEYDGQIIAKSKIVLLSQ